MSRSPKRTRKSGAEVRPKRGKGNNETEKRKNAKAKTGSVSRSPKPSKRGKGDTGNRRARPSKSDRGHKNPNRPNDRRSASGGSASSKPGRDKPRGGKASGNDSRKRNQGGNRKGGKSGGGRGGSSKKTLATQQKSVARKQPAKKGGEFFTEALTEIALADIQHEIEIRRLEKVYGEEVLEEARQTYRRQKLDEGLVDFMNSSSPRPSPEEALRFVRLTLTEQLAYQHGKNKTHRRVLEAKMMGEDDDFDLYMEYAEDLGISYEDAIDIWFSPNPG